MIQINFFQRNEQIEDYSSKETGRDTKRKADLEDHGVIKKTKKDTSKVAKKYLKDK